MESSAKKQPLVERRFEHLVAEVRAHEVATRRKVTHPSRPQDDRLYRRLRQINGMTEDDGEVMLLGYPPDHLPYE